MKKIVFFLLVIIFGILINACTARETFSRYFPLSDDIKNEFDIRIENETGHEKIVIIGSDIQNITFKIDVFDRPYIMFQFTINGGRRFFRLTRQNQGKTLNVYLNNALFVSPTIAEPIRNRANLNLGVEEVDFLVSKSAFAPSDLVE